MKRLFIYRHTSISVVLVVLFGITRAAAGQVYVWVDDAGTTHYSESPPQDPSRETRQLELPKIPQTGDIPADYYSVINQLQRMQTRRLENEKLIAERKQAEAEAARAMMEAEATREEPIYPDAEPRYYPAYPLHGYRPHHGRRPDHRPGYGPGYRPGHRPGRPSHLPAPGYPRFHKRSRRPASF